MNEEDSEFEKDVQEALDLFLDVFELDAESRARVLAVRCDGRKELRRRVDELLLHHDCPGTLVHSNLHLRAPLTAASSTPAEGRESIDIRREHRPVWRRPAIASLFAVGLVALVWIGGNGLRFANARESAREALAAATRAVATDPVACRRHLDEVPQAQRCETWHELLDRIDPVQARYAFEDESRWHSEGDVIFLPDGVALAVIASGHQLVVIDLATGIERTRLEAAEPVRLPRFAPDGRSVAAWVTSPPVTEASVVQWSTVTGAQLASYRLPVNELTELHFSPDANAVYWQQGASGVQLDVATGSTKPLEASLRVVLNGIVSPSGAMSLQLEEPESLWREHRTRLVRLGASSKTLRAATFSGDEHWLASADFDGRLRLYRCVDGQPVRTFARSASRLALNRDGSKLLALSASEVVLMSVR